VGFLPADDPRAVILVLIDEPSTATYGGVVAAPVFRNIAEATMRILGVEARRPPTSEPPPTQMASAAGKRAKRPASRAPSPPEPPPAVTSAPFDVASAPSAGTPSFLGLSLREALLRAQQVGLAVELRGSGWVTQQEPAPGSPLAADRRLALELGLDRGTLRP
jgi:cell division protein FtsI (penicillin-binding protein 3)